MKGPVLLDMRPETGTEAALREWLEKQALASPETLEAAARQIITLATALLGVLFGVLAVAQDPLPAYLRLPEMRGLGVAAVGLLLFSLLAALAAVLPRAWGYNPAAPVEEEALFYKILRLKSTALAISTVAFGLAALAFGAVLILALLKV